MRFIWVGNNNIEYLNAKNNIDDFQKLKTDIIQFDEKTKTKIISNLYFEDLILNIDTFIDSLFRNKVKVSKQFNLSHKINDNKKYEANKVVFENCKFDFLNISTLSCNVEFSNCKISTLLISNLENEDKNDYSIFINNGEIFKFRIKNSEIKNNLHINHNSQNKLEIVDLNISSCIFEKDFSFHNVIIKNAEIKDCDFNSLSEFVESEFTEKFNFDEITYKGFTLFDNCTFNAIAKFKYVIFEKFTSFRGSKFNKGIDLEYTSNDKEINFHGIEILDKTTTSQETYRIIKNQFEKLNNKIEANKYHALELVQRKKELEKDKWKYFSEYLVFIIHDLSSKHSTSWFRAVLWIIFVGFFTIFLVHFDIVKDLFFHPSNFKIEYLSKIWSEFWQYINITNLERLKDKPFIFFLNKLSLGYLYYQFLTAVRKDTRK